MPKIFLSYRRADSGGWVRTIDQRLTEVFGRDNVFRDIPSIPPGADFLNTLKAKLSECTVVLVVIGQMWSAISGRSHRRRLLEEDDIVRQEIESAIDLGLWLVPVLVGHATLPTKNQLPEKLQALTKRQAYVLTDKHFEADLDDLITALRGLTIERDNIQAQEDLGSGAGSNEHSHRDASVSGNRPPPSDLNILEAFPLDHRSSAFGDLRSLLADAIALDLKSAEKIAPTVVDITRTGDRWTFEHKAINSQTLFGEISTVGTSVVGHSVLDEILGQLIHPRDTETVMKLGELLYQLVVPKPIRQVMESARALLLQLDPEADKIPWEFLKPKGNALPFGLSKGVIRQFRDTDQKMGHSASRDEQECLVFVGAMDAPFIDLPGARKEADEVATLIQQAGFGVRRVSDVGPLEAVLAISLTSWCIVHLVGHGVDHWSPEVSLQTDGESSLQLTGLMIGEGVALSIHEVMAADMAPELLSVGAMQLTSWAPVALKGGCSVFLTLGGPADDDAIRQFFSEFYRLVGAGESTFRSLVGARRTLAHESPFNMASGLWVRCYGDGGYRISRIAQKDAPGEAPQSACP
ncbi:CHAT domain-containing protein [Cognatazoarcus halotolerans]|uniref:CHAT domain-containing protein n=1 Tax=Cognatazoarcus halotolerans TaxID=2686016 RepID=UPI001358D18E|nr:CHAT domain-containing protein [Cognatazoarcus halotolerans]MCB1901841.1 CHAT domain-containing protein [Rhodocyclaceae bacterium]MCP5310193.1 CHAT domain-containing protein [Zoogloeaceae bacterium]